MHHDRDAYPYRYGVYLMGYYIANAVYQGFISVYLKGTGLGVSQISLIMAAMPFVSIFAQPIWGAVSDRSRSRTRVLRVLYLCAAGTVLCYGISSNFWWLLPLVAAFACFHTPIQPLGESILLEALSAKRQKFGPIRLMGTVAFAIVSKIVGDVLKGHPLSFVLYLTSALLLLAALTTFLLPPVEGHQSAGRRLSVRVLLRDRKLMKLLGFVTLLQITMGYYYVFFPVHFSGMPGGGNGMLGWAYLISALSELPFLLNADRLFDKIGAGRLLLIASVALTLRWLLLALFASPTIVLITQVLHGWGFIVITVAMAKYISATVPPELRASGQTLLGMVGFGVARVVGSLIGVVADQIGVQHGFFITACITAFSLLTFGLSYLREPPLNGQT